MSSCAGSLARMTDVLKFNVFASHRSSDRPRKTFSRNLLGPARSVSTVPSIDFVASGQAKLRRIDGWRKIAAVLGEHTEVALGI